MLRRELIKLIAAANLLAVTACQQGNTNLATAATDIAAIASGLLNVLPQFGSIPGINSIPNGTALIAQIGQWVADLQAAAASISTTASATAAQPIVQQVEADVNAIVGAVAAFAVIPGSISLALTAAVYLLPIIEAAINMLLPPVPPVAPSITPTVPPVTPAAAAKGRVRFKAPPSYSEAQAVADLHALAVR